MDVRDFLINNDEELKSYTESAQYKLSRKIMRLRYSISFSAQSMANALNLSFKDYVALESGNTMIKEEYYVSIIKKIDNYIEKYLVNLFETMLNKEVSVKNAKFNFDNTSDYYNEANNLTKNEFNLERTLLREVA